MSGAQIPNPVQRPIHPLQRRESVIERHAFLHTFAFTVLHKFTLQTY